ncbi:MAG: hypothetical protein ABIB43_01560 [archaeon]
MEGLEGLDNIRILKGANSPDFGKGELTFFKQFYLPTPKFYSELKKHLLKEKKFLFATKVHKNLSIKELRDKKGIPLEYLSYALKLDICQTPYKKLNKVMKIHGFKQETIDTSIGFAHEVLNNELEHGNMDDITKSLYWNVFGMKFADYRECWLGFEDWGLQQLDIDNYVRRENRGLGIDLIMENADKFFLTDNNSIMLSKYERL